MLSYGDKAGNRAQKNSQDDNQQKRLGDAFKEKAEKINLRGKRRNFAGNEIYRRVEYSQCPRRRKQPVYPPFGDIRSADMPVGSADQTHYLNFLPLIKNGEADGVKRY